MITLQNINKEFKNKKRKVQALKDINLSFFDNGLNFIVGESGAGKSSLLNILSLQDVPTSGKLIIDNIDTSTLKEKDLATLRSKYFGIIFQNLNLINDFSVYYNISLGLEIQKQKISKEEVIKILKKLHLKEDIIDEKVKNLSGGQKQRIAIARAIIKNSQVIICDEITGSLDSKNSHEIMEILKEISKDKIIIIVSHNLDLAKKYGDRIITLEEGKIIEDTNNKQNEKNIDELQIGKHNRLSFLSLIKLTILSLKQSITKLIFTLIAFIITLSILISSLTIFSYNPNKAKEEIIKSDDITYFTLRKMEKNSPEIGDIYQNDDLFFRESDISKIENYYDQTSCILGHYNNYITNSTDLNYGYNNQEMYYIRTISTINQEQLDLLELKLIGRLANDNAKEIVLTNYICYELGWLSLEEINNEDALKNIIKSYNYNLKLKQDEEIITFDIVGIINTKRIIKEKRSEGYAKYCLYADSYGLHNVLFFSNKMFNEIVHIDEKEALYSKVFISSKNKYFSKVDPLLKQLENEKIDVKAYSQLDNTLFSLNSLKHVYGLLTMGIAIALLVISLFTLIGYTRLVVQLNMKNITILRSLGLTLKDSSLIFILQSFILSFICVMFSIFPYSLALYFVNNYLKETIMTNYAPLKFSIILILLIFIFMILLTSIIAIISMALAFLKKRIKVGE